MTVRWRERLRVADAGSGTILGVALIMVVGLFLGGVGIAGRVMYCQAVAQTGADAAAISAAKALSGISESSSPCGDAERAATANSAALERCAPDGSDAQVRVSVETGVPLVSRVSADSRAGPAGCDEGSGEE
jgi:secretion/DNA translocation related TadE-like protein